MNLIISLVVGSALGAVLGYFGRCSTGTCPLTANPWRGALYGAVLGLLFYFASGRDRAVASSESSANVKLVTEAQFDAEVAKASGPVVIDFFATWCGPCKRLSPMLDELAGPLNNRIQFFKVDSDQSSKLAEKFGVEALPTLVFMKNGKVVDTVVGLPAKADLQAKLAAFAGLGHVASASR